MRLFMLRSGGIIEVAFEHKSKAAKCVLSSAMGLKILLNTKNHTANFYMKSALFIYVWIYPKKR